MSDGELKPVWIRVPVAMRISGIKKTRLFELIAEQKIRTRLIKQRRDSKRGIRLISYDSLMQFIDNEGGDTNSRVKYPAAVDRLKNSPEALDALRHVSRSCNDH